jgi:hypothetical protein
LSYPNELQILFANSTVKTFDIKLIRIQDFMFSWNKVQRLDGYGSPILEKFNEKSSIIGLRYSPPKLNLFYNKNKFNFMG